MQPNFKDFVEWDVDEKPVTMPGDVQLNRYVNSVTVSNTGTVNLIVNGDLLVPGTFKSYGGEPRSLFKGTITLKWLLQSPAPSTIIRQAFVTQIFYVNHSPTN